MCQGCTEMCNISGLSSEVAFGAWLQKPLWFSSLPVHVIPPLPRTFLFSKRFSSCWLSIVGAASYFHLLVLLFAVHLVAFVYPPLRFCPTFFLQADVASPVRFALSCEFSLPGWMRPLELKCSVCQNHTDFCWCWGRSWGKQDSLETGSLLF